MNANSKTGVSYRYVCKTCGGHMELMGPLREHHKLHHVNFSHCNGTLQKVCPCGERPHMFACPDGVGDED